MDRNLRSLSFSFATTLLAVSAAHAQIATLTLPQAGAGDDPRGVFVIGSNHLAVSTRIDGIQHMINITNPASPTITTSYNPPFGDQWFEAEYNRVYGGRLFTAHRGGGLNMIDVSNPAAPVALSSLPTNYHFRGLKYQPNGAGGALYYNETNLGLGVFNVNAPGTVMSGPVWNNYINNGTQDGNGLEILGSELYQFGTPPNNTANRLLTGFNISSLFAPVVNFNGFFNNQQVPNGHQQLRRVPGLPYIMASRWTDGLDLFDMTVPTAPVQYPGIVPSAPNIVCWGLQYVPASPFAIAYGRVTIGTSVVAFWYVMQILPGPVIFPSFIVTHNMDTHDIACDPSTGRIYVVGTDLNNGLSKLWVF